MENVLLGKIENDGKTCSWPEGSREAKVVQIINQMSQPISDELMKSIMNAPLAKCKSDSLFQLSLELGLTLDCIPDDLNLFFIAQDVNTKEATHMLLAPKANNDSEKITELIRMVNNECIGTRTEDNQTVANELFTIIANVVAQYCASDPQYKEAFLNVIKYWEDNIIKENENINKDNK
jgi:hypothetical protein